MNWSTMDWNTATWILANRDEAEGRYGDDAVLNALRCMINEIKPHIKDNFDTDGLGDWLDNGDWDGDGTDLTPAEVAQQWDDLSAY
jgi:hypothetical protein